MREKLFIDLTWQENAVLSPDGVILEVGDLAWNYSFRYLVWVSVLRFFYRSLHFYPWEGCLG